MLNSSIAGCCLSSLRICKRKVTQKSSKWEIFPVTYLLFILKMPLASLLCRLFSFLFSVAFVHVDGSAMRRNTMFSFLFDAAFAALRRAFCACSFCRCGVGERGRFVKGMVLRCETLRFALPNHTFCRAKRNVWPAGVLPPCGAAACAG